MDSKKLLLGTLAGGVTSFLLGWLIYGILLDSFMKENSNQCFMKPMEEMVWWAMIASNLVIALLVTLVLTWSNVSGFMPGLQRAGLFGLLFGLSLDLGFYGMSTMFNNMTVMFVDVCACAVMTAISGGVIGAVMEMGAKKSS